MSHPIRHVLFLCAGNTCRSPMAAALFRRHLETLGAADRFETKSAGLEAAAGRATPEAVELMKARGPDLSGHSTRRVDDEIVAWADLVLVMTARQLEVVGDSFSGARGKTHLLAVYAGRGNEDVVDPMDRGTAAYRLCVELLDDLTGRVARRLV